MQGKQYAWLIFGIDDKKHEFVNTNYRKGSNINGLKKEITKFTNDNMTFMDIYEFEVDGNRVIMFKIPAAIGVPTTWRKIAYDRNDEELTILNEAKRNIILSTVNIDWSRQIIPGLTVEDLDNKGFFGKVFLGFFGDGGAKRQSRQTRSERKGRRDSRGRTSSFFIV